MQTRIHVLKEKLIIYIIKKAQQREQTDKLDFTVYKQLAYNLIHQLSVLLENTVKQALVLLLLKIVLLENIHLFTESKHKVNVNLIVLQDFIDYKALLNLLDYENKGFIDL